MSEQNSRMMPILAGFVLTGVGAAHFIRPHLFEDFTKVAFPRDTTRNIYTNGGIETAIGVGLLISKTRRLAVLGSLGYIAYVAGNAIRNR